MGALSRVAELARHSGRLLALPVGGLWATSAVAEPRGLPRRPPARPKLPGIGFGRFRLDRRKKERPLFPQRRRVKLPARYYLLLKGSVAEAQGWEDGPNLWWSDDRAWWVASEIDFPYTYVAGTSRLIDDVLHHPDLEALPATVADGITYSSDTINS